MVKSKVITIVIAVIVAMVSFVASYFAYGLIVNHFTPVDCKVDVERYQAKIDSLNVTLGQAIEIIASSNKLIDTLEAIAVQKDVLLEYKIKEVNNLETRRELLKKENETLLDQTIRHINLNPTYIDSLRRKHFGG